MIPTLETERLLLRPHRLSDFESYVEMWADPDVVRFIGGQPYDRENTWSRFLRTAGGWHHLGFGFFAIEEKATGLLVGEAGFHELHRRLEPSIEGTLEAAWALMPTGQGWGYATEAMSAAISWAELVFPDRRMTCIIDPDNLPSVRVATRLGFVELVRTTYHDRPIVVYERRR
jgi:RimJ/RimL family protein N-acetyltransferase